MALIAYGEVTKFITKVYSNSSSYAYVCVYCISYVGMYAQTYDWETVVRIETIYNEDKKFMYTLLHNKLNSCVENK